MIGIIVWFTAPFFAEDPLKLLEKETPVQVWTDRNGEVIWNRRTFDARWMFPVPLDVLPSHLIDTMLAVEDKRFFQHNGVDCGSLFRAFLQNIRNARVISGASTISMQTAGLTLPGPKRSLIRKFRQCARARKMERHHSKKEILETYFNRVHFGGKLYGIQAASLYYFGVSASRLNRLEGALLCGLVRRPSATRPDRYPEAAQERLRIVLKLMVRSGSLTQTESERLFQDGELHFRDFSHLPIFMEQGKNNEWIHAVQLAESREKTKKHSVCRCTIDSTISERILSILRRRISLLDGVHDGAAVLIDSHTGQIWALIGTLDFHSPKSGQVNGAVARRSGGSSLKPFIYAEAVEGGLISAGTFLDDSPVRYGSYAPGNYDGTYRGNVSASEALSASLNTPVIRLLSTMGTARIQTLFRKTGLLEQTFSGERDPGLSLALGSAGHRLIDMTNAYRIFSSGGIFRPCTLNMEEQIPAGLRIFSKGTCSMISAMLRSHPLPCSSIPAAWKTGTSSNNCDAWCFAFTPDWTLGVWFGNKSGKGSPTLSGLEAAAPAAGEIMDMLYTGKSMPIWDDSFLENTELCEASGLTPSGCCSRRKKGSVVRNIPLRCCTLCSGVRKTPVRIYKPEKVVYVVKKNNSLLLPLRADRKVHWFIDGKSAGKSIELSLSRFSTGNHRVTAFSEEDDAPAGEVCFRIESASP